MGRLELLPASLQEAVNIYPTTCPIRIWSFARAARSTSRVVFSGRAPIVLFLRRL